MIDEEGDRPLGRWAMAYENDSGMGGDGVRKPLLGR